MDNMKKVMICLIIAIVVSAIVLVIALNTIKHVDNGDIVVTEEPELLIETNTGVSILDNKDIFFMIEQIAQKYLDYCTNKDANSLYNAIDNRYISNNQITEYNIFEKNEFIYDSSELVFDLEKVYTREIDINIMEYFIYGNVYNIQNTENIDVQDLYLTVIIDYINKTYSIIPIPCKFVASNKDEEISIIQKYMEDTKYLKLEEIEFIVKNSNNFFNYSEISDIEMILNYLSDFAEKIMYNPQKAYSILDPDYSKAKFKDFGEFEKFSKNIEFANIINYTIKRYDGYTQYICEDGYGKRYIFNETAIMQYTVEMDDYTIENEELTQRYEKLSSKEKGIINIQKFFEMINNLDYKVAYEKLDSNFRNTYFKTVEEFENYMKNHVFRYNVFDKTEYSNEIKGIHSYKVLLKDATYENETEIEFNIVMKLLDNADFVMSFEV